MERDNDEGTVCWPRSNNAIYQDGVPFPSPHCRDEVYFFSHADFASYASCMHNRKLPRLPRSQEAPD